MHLDYVQRPSVHRLEIIGTRGTIRWDNANGAVWVYSVDGSIETYPVPPHYERNDMFLAEIRHFVDMVRGETEPLCTLDDGIWALKLALAVHDSSRSGEMITWE